ncbi:hypothetical protein V6N11_028759 [Hibiscus sabdariffa]|uniref:Uncharacterized protein n=1 Tax=Hibiscus sabdariffa TaxID=183260 RepID=A0ABR2PRB9_9ROSI
MEACSSEKMKGITHGAYKPHADSGEVAEIRKADNNVKINKKRKDYNEDEDEDLDQLQNNKGIRHIGELLTANSTVVFPVSGSLIDSRIAGFSNNSFLSVTSNSLMLEGSSQQANFHASNWRDCVSAVCFQNGNTLSNFASIDLVSSQLRDSKADLQGQAAPVNCNAGPMIRSVAQEWNAPRKDAPYQSHLMSISVNYFNPVHGMYSDPVQYRNTVGLNSRPVRMLNSHLIQNMPFTKDLVLTGFFSLCDLGGFLGVICTLQYKNSVLKKMLHDSVSKLANLQGRRILPPRKRAKTERRVVNPEDSENHRFRTHLLIPYVSPSEETSLCSMDIEFENRGTKRKHGDESEDEDGESNLSSMDVDEHGDLTL